MAVPGIGATPGPAKPSERDAGGSLRSILIEQVQDFVSCPLRFAFRHVYQAPAAEEPSQIVQARAVGEMFVWIHTQLMINRQLSWGAILSEWEKRWGAIGKDKGYPISDVFQGRDLGTRALLDVWESVTPNTEILGVHYPCRRTIGSWELVGQVDVIRALETKGKGRSGRIIQLITIDPTSHRTPMPSEAGRRMDYLMAKYGLEAELRQSMEKLGKVETCVYLPRIPKLATLEIEGSAFRSALRWCEWVFEGIEAGHFYPRTGTTCSACEYAEICDVKYVSNEALESHAAQKEVQELCRLNLSSRSRPTSMQQP